MVIREHYIATSLHFFFHVYFHDRGRGIEKDIQCYALPAISFSLFLLLLHIWLSSALFSSVDVMMYVILLVGL